MAGALEAATNFSAISIGSGHSVGGGDYPAGTKIRAWNVITVATSAATIVASGVSTQTATATGYGIGDYISSCVSGILPNGVSSQVYLSGSSQISISFSNLSTATTTVPITQVLVELLKITP